MMSRLGIDPVFITVFLRSYFVNQFVLETPARPHAISCAISVGNGMEK